jgi:hypothetical protein
MVTTQVACQVLQIGNAPRVSAILGGNSLQPLVERLLLALSHDTYALAEYNSRTLFQDNMWDVAAQQPNWLAISSQASTPVTDSLASTLAEDTTEGYAVAGRLAAVDMVFAELGDDTDDFSDN